MDQANFQSIYCTCISIDLNARKVECMLQQNQYHIILCIQLLLQFYVLYMYMVSFKKLMKLTEA